ncbi:MAG: ABC transporter ATP-binding protein [Planctomycetota bacterium]|nr:ABC transporter ATP-binding protein [Planctomycetota bacterium]
MIQIQEVAKNFGALCAVGSVSLEVAPGEVLGLLGPNGAGKSTTLRMLTGFLAPDAGTASIDGHDIREDRLRAQACLGYLPEGAPSWEAMTPRELFRFLSKVHGLAGDVAIARAAAATELADLNAVLDQPIDTLSKGLRRRVGLGAAVLHDPPALVLDEPTDGLDPNQKRNLRRNIRALATDQHKAIIVSTHILEEVSALCDRLVVIAKGAVVFTGKPSEFAALTASGQLDAAFRQVTEDRA